jgi:hypothetical protein
MWRSDQTQGPLCPVIFKPRWHSQALSSEWPDAGALYDLMRKGCVRSYLTYGDVSSSCVENFWTVNNQRSRRGRGVPDSFDHRFATRGALWKGTWELKRAPARPVLDCGVSGLNYTDDQVDHWDRGDAVEPQWHVASIGGPNAGLGASDRPNLCVRSMCSGLLCEPNGSILMEPL